MTEEMLASIIQPDSEADRTYSSEWRTCVLERAWQAIELHQQQNADNLFYSVLQLYSDDPKTKQDCGTFGLVNATTSLPDNLKKVVLGLKQGEISDPIRDISGFYIVRVDGQVLRPLSDVFEPIVQELRQSHLDAYLKELQAKFQPQVLEQGFFLNPDDYMNRAREPIRK